MITASRSAPFKSTGHGPAARKIELSLKLDPTATARPAPAPAPDPRPCAGHLQGLLTDGSRVAWRDRAAFAASAFTQGNGFVPGQIIDRNI